MDRPANGPRPTGIPRLSRLPVLSTTVRPSPSTENLQQPSRPLTNPRLRNASSRDHLSKPASARPHLVSAPPKARESTPGLPRENDGAVDAAIDHPRHPSAKTLFRKPSKPVLREQEPGKLYAGHDEELIRTDGSFTGAECDGEEHFSERDIPRRSQPSLSERTAETLHQIPSSPALRKTRSSFFNSDSSLLASSSTGQISRPGSSYQSDASLRPPSESTSSRPTSSAGSGQFPTPQVPTLSNPSRGSQPTIQAHTPIKRIPPVNSIKTPSNIRSNTAPLATGSSSKPPSLGFSTSAHQQSPSPVKSTAKVQLADPGSRALSSRPPLKPRGSVNGLFRKSSMQSLNQSGDVERIGFGAKKKVPAFSNASSEESSTIFKASKTMAVTSGSGDDQDVSPRKSSLALRDQIARAKAAKRSTTKQVPGPSFDHQEIAPVLATGTFDFGLPSDPFNQQANQSKGLLAKRIDAARTDGRLNIAAMGLKEIPAEVMNMYSLESTSTHGISWAESVDLTRFIAADNELELLHDDVFPDIDPRVSGNDDDDGTIGQFGGLETLDLHGNLLVALPVGLRRLELLTTLNLSNNKLGNECIQVITQITSLRDLKIAGNDLSAVLDGSIASLTNLEVLDIHSNALTSLPEELSELARLRILNVAENRLSSLPWGALRRLPLAELLASKNNLTGVLVSAEIQELAQLQVIDITSNSLTELTISTSLKLPLLRRLNCSFNRLTGLPDMTSWIALVTLAAADNNIESIPEGFVALPNIRNVDFSGNNLKVLDDRIGAMESLDAFSIHGNPLRERKFSGMTTEDLKEALKARLIPIKLEADNEADIDGTTASSTSPNRLVSSDWQVKAGGVLDRSNTQSHSLNPVAASKASASNIIRDVQLHHNAFREIPSSLAFFAATLTSLSLAHNELNSDTFMKDDLGLPVLRELNLSSNTFNSVMPLTQHLHAPKLEKLDISFNRLTTLPSLKLYFPTLTTLLASNNTIRELSPASVRGLRVLDCSSNDINSLNARIGLLGGPGGLERLDVSGNRFRVPKYTILEKGTEATLAWLRDRIPAGGSSPVDGD